MKVKYKNRSITLFRRYRIDVIFCRYKIVFPTHSFAFSLSDENLLLFFFPPNQYDDKYNICFGNAAHILYFGSSTIFLCTTFLHTRIKLRFFFVFCIFDTKSIFIVSFWYDFALFLRNCCVCLPGDLVVQN